MTKSLKLSPFSSSCGYHEHFYDDFIHCISSLISYGLMQSFGNLVCRRYIRSRRSLNFLLGTWEYARPCERRVRLIYRVYIILCSYFQLLPGLTQQQFGAHAMVSVPQSAKPAQLLERRLSHLFKTTLGRSE